jgi:hypothetical protein
MLNDNEWELLDELCNILAPFGKATRDFSGNTCYIKSNDAYYYRSYKFFGTM